MDGGPERILSFALKNPSVVQGLVVMDYSPGPGEYGKYQIVHNLTHEDALAYAISTVESRLSLGNIIRGIAVQWGLMGVFAPPASNSDRLELEKLYLNIYNEKQWQTQLIYLAKQLATPSDLLSFDEWYSANSSLSGLPPVLWFNRNLNMIQECIDNKYTQEQCQEATETNALAEYYIHLAVDAVPGGKLFLVNGTSGFLSQGKNIPFAVETILANI
jgi:hypothetical protein